MSTVESYLTSLKEHWPHFVCNAIMERGLLSDAGIQDHYDKTIREMESQSDEFPRKLQKETSEPITEAQRLAKEIESRARRTAAKVSVEAAQTQFKEAQSPLTTQLCVWGVLSVASIGSFFFLLHNFFGVELSDASTPQIIYLSGLRLAALGAIVSIAAFCLGMLRSQLHLFQLNHHRRRLTN